MWSSERMNQNDWLPIYLYLFFGYQNDLYKHAMGDDARARQSPSKSPVDLQEVLLIDTHKKLLPIYSQVCFSCVLRRLRDIPI